MKLYVDTSGKTVTVSRETEPKTDQNGQQKVEKGTGRLQLPRQLLATRTGLMHQWHEPHIRPSKNYPTAENRSGP